MGADSLEAFPHPWPVHPVYTFRKGMRRTWVVQSTESPGATKVQHDYGLAVVQEALPRPAPAEKKVERWQPPSKSSTNSTPQPPRSWAEVVQPKAPVGPRRGSPSVTAATVATPKAAVPAHNLQEMVAAAITAALRPYHHEIQKMSNSIVELQKAQMDFSDIEFEEVEADPAPATLAGATAPATLAGGTCGEAKPPNAARKKLKIKVKK